MVALAGAWLKWWNVLPVVLSTARLLDCVLAGRLLGLVCWVPVALWGPLRSWALKVWPDVRFHCRKRENGGLEFDSSKEPICTSLRSLVFWERERFIDRFGYVRGERFGA